MKRNAARVKPSSFDVSNNVLNIILSITFILPFWIIVVSSFSDNSLLMKNGVSLWFQGFTLDGYKYLFRMSDTFFRSILVTGIVAFVSSIISVALCTSAAYVLSRKRFFGRKLFNILFMIPMFFSGGTIATFLVIKDINLYNTIWALILPVALRIPSILLMRNFFYSIPDTLSEAAEMDGCNEFSKMIRIYLPLAVPMMFTIGLIIFVSRWNDWLDALMYFDTTNSSYWTIQYVLRQILTNSGSIMNSADATAPIVTARNAAIVVSVAPLIILSPLLHKYYVKGMMAGSIK